MRTDFYLFCWYSFARCYYSIQGPLSIRCFIFILPVFVNQTLLEYSRTTDYSMFHIYSVGSRWPDAIRAFEGCRLFHVLYLCTHFFLSCSHASALWECPQTSPDLYHWADCESVLLCSFSKYTRSLDHGVRYKCKTLDEPKFTSVF